jgi:hypothetical protein
MFYYISHKLRGGQFMGNGIKQPKTELGSLELYLLNRLMLFPFTVMVFLEVRYPLICELLIIRLNFSL